MSSQAAASAAPCPDPTSTSATNSIGMSSGRQASSPDTTKRMRWFTSSNVSLLLDAQRVAMQPRLVLDQRSQQVAADVGDAGFIAGQMRDVR